ncbi:MAG: c-type cytochrome biogenesis protein CcmI [Candidatus Accumulibacter sp.]|jgi:cytochrome c-type biogenesis protein CcmH|nr:c-type cytochrome biogenesis protein CcmI [Accumulibacter sp.]
MIVFVLLASALLLSVLGHLLSHPPKREAQDIRRCDACLPIFREQRAELERDRERGFVSENDFVQTRSEIGRRFLEEERNEDENAGARGVSRAESELRATSLALALFVSLLALSVYVVLGRPEAIALGYGFSRSVPALSPSIDESRDEPRAESKEAENWIRLARVYKESGRLTEAAEAFARGGKRLDGDAAALVDYAETLLLINDGRFDAKIDDLLGRAFAREANMPRALVLLGLSAAKRGDLKAAVDLWERLLPRLDPASEEAGMVKKAIGEARRLRAVREKTS